jgi:CRISPR-associated protein Csb2
MIAFRIEYLTGAVRAADFATGNAKSAPEWPPHPARLFSALVSAWAAAGHPEDGRRALEWLERLPPPVLHAADARARSGVVSYVPANDDLSLPAVRRRNPRRFAVAVPDADVVHMIWTDATPSPDIAQALQRLTTLVPCLGHSSSLVDVRLSDESPPPTLVPADTGVMRLRVPGPGRLTTLEGLHRSGRRADAGRWHLYGPVEEPARRPLAGDLGQVFIFRMGNVIGPLPLVATLQLCAAMRGAMMAHADQPVPEVISGHAPGSTAERPLPSARPHMAFAPLADVGHRHARGHVMGIAVVLPRVITPPERRACLRALGRIEVLRLGTLGRMPLERLGADVDRWNLMAETWTRPSRVWASITPVVFGRFPTDPFGEEAQRMIAVACVQAGLPEPDVVSLNKVSWVSGAPAAHEYPARPAGAGRPRRFHVHVCLGFHEPVAGPVIVGAGRFYGYGLCRPLEEAS